MALWLELSPRSKKVLGLKPSDWPRIGSLPRGSPQCIKKVTCLYSCVTFSSLSAQSSVTGRPPTVGAWTRTGERFLARDHTMSSNQPVSVLSPDCKFHATVLQLCFNSSNLAPGLPSVAPPTMRPFPRPDVTPPASSDITLLYAQGQKIGALPLNGTRLDATRSKTLLTLHVKTCISNCTCATVGCSTVNVSHNMCSCSRTSPGLHRCWIIIRLQRQPSLLDRFVCKDNQ